MSLRTASLALAIMIGSTGASWAAEGDAKAGKKVFKRCIACHEISKTKNKVGPNLVGIIDRKAGIVEKFKYSKALLKMAEEGLVWNVENLDKYLTKPKDFIKGGKMAFAGLKNPKDRTNLIAYLKEASEPKAE